MPGYAAERVASNVAQTYVPVAVNSGIVFGLRVVEMDCAHAIRSDVSFERSNSRIESFRLAHVVASSEGVRRVKTDTKIEFRAGFYYLATMLEAMAYALALPRR